MKRNLFVALFALITYCTVAQDVYHQSATRNRALEVTEDKKSLINPKLVTFDLAALSNKLQMAPRRSDGNGLGVIISLPNSNGSTSRFRVSENSNFDPELAARYPEIQSYVGIGIDDFTATVYFSLSPLGLQAMTLHADKPAEFIEPYSTDRNVYTIYVRSDRPADIQGFICHVTDELPTGLSPLFRPNADDSFLRTFRLAVSVTGEYTAFFGGTKALALAAINNTITRVNGVFERDFAARLVLVANNDTVIYTNASTDPYAIASIGVTGAWSSQVQSTLTSVIGESKYDVGHLFGRSGGGGNAGCIGCVCVNNQKGRGYSSPANGIPSGDYFDIDYVAHEIGHQFGATHTFTHANETPNSQMEPGSGSTIMSYAGITTKDVQSHSDAYFHAVSIQQVTNNIKLKTCATKTATGNAIPVVDAGLNYTIPKSTPFSLTGTATDSNGDALTYAWEQMDMGSSTTTVPSATKTAGPNFRSFPPTTSPTRYFPKLSSVLAGATTTAGSELIVESLSSVARTMNFRLTVRDNRPGGGGNNSDDMIVTVSSSAGPFVVNNPNTAVSYAAGSSQTITWSVAGTTANGINCANVDILLSTDGGQTFPITLATATPNDGSQSVVIPNSPGTTNRIMIKGTNHVFFDVSNSNFAIIGGIVDTIVPATPTLLVASLTTQNGTRLVWVPSTDNIGVTGYNIYQNGTLKGTSSTPLYNVSGLTPSTSYSFFVRAKDAAGNLSVASNAVSVTTLSNGPDTTAPSKPLNLAASGTTQNKTTLNWSASTDNIGIASYSVYRNGAYVASPTSTTYTVTGLNPSTNYTFTVKGKDAAGNLSVASNAVSVTTLSGPDTTAPSKPLNLAASATTQNKTTLHWSASTDNIGIASYSVYRNGAYVASPTSTTYTVTGLNPSTNYTFTVKGKDAAGNLSIASNAVTVKTLSNTVDTTPPSKPTNLTAGSTTQTSTKLSWTGSTDNIAVATYSVYRNGSYVGAATTTNYTVTGLSANTTYAFTVKAKDAAANLSTVSNTVTVTTLSATGSYCASKGNSVSYEKISKVQFGSINMVSSGGSGYTSFTTASTNVSRGSTYSINITPEWTNTKYNEGYAVWIDYNKDGDFSDAGELVWSKSPSTATPISGAITIPTTATLGTTRMRVSMKYNGIPTSCEVFARGQVEDYTVNIVASGRMAEDEKQPLSIALYPNPVEGDILSISGLESDAEYKVYNLLGQSVREGKTSGNSISVRGLSAATYLLQIIYQDEVITKKFIRQ